MTNDGLRTSNPADATEQPDGEVDHKSSSPAQPRSSKPPRTRADKIAIATMSALGLSFLALVVFFAIQAIATGGGFWQPKDTVTSEASVPTQTQAVDDFGQPTPAPTPSRPAAPDSGLAAANEGFATINGILADIDYQSAGTVRDLVYHKMDNPRGVVTRVVITFDGEEAYQILKPKLWVNDDRTCRGSETNMSCRDLETGIETTLGQTSDNSVRLEIVVPPAGASKPTDGR